MILTRDELRYLDEQVLGRLATVSPEGVPQNNPVGFRWNAATETIDIGGWNMTASRKFRNVWHAPRVAFVVDDLASRDPWTVRGIEIRGEAEALADEGIIRIHPRRVISWGINPGEAGMRGRDIARVAV